MLLSDRRMHCSFSAIIERLFALAQRLNTMEFASVTAASPGLAALSNYFFIAGAGLLVVMTLAYLWYTIGSARLANKIEAAQARTRSQARKASKAASVAVAAEGGVTTLVKDDVVMREQDDGERPIALDRTI